MEISDPTQLLALHRAIMEAKFSKEPSDLALIGSCALAEVADRVLHALISARAELDGSQIDWEEWRRVGPDRWEWDRLKSRHLATSWADWSRSEKAEFVAILFSPLTVSKADVSLFIDEVDALV